MAGDGAAPTGGAPVADLQYLIDHDQLTGLRNRHGFERELRELLERPDRADTGAVVAIGIDNFRHLNATHGREIGDLVLAAAASVVASVAADHDSAARIGGDTFAVLLHDADQAHAEAAAVRLLEAIRGTDLGFGDGGVRTTASAGIALLGRERVAPGDLLLEADLAMARAKQNGRDRVTVYTRTEHRAFKVEAAWADSIRRALESDALEVHAQEMRSLKGFGSMWELLLRLPQANGQLLSPSAFLPTAERFGLVERLDLWVLERAMRLKAVQPSSTLELAINVSARSLTGERFAERVAALLADADIDPAGLIFEVDEDAIENLDEVRLSVQRLRQIGCRFALDRFGTGHASLARLKQLPSDFLKIDGSFVRHLAQDAAHQEIVRAVIALGHGLARSVVAVHVGDQESVRLLEDYGVDYVQGFHVGRSRPFSALERDFA